MFDRSRRHALQLLGAATAAAAGGTLITRSPAADVKYTPEAGAELRVLRWKRFVQGDEDQWMVNTRKFTELTGVNVRVDSENFEDIRPKAAVAANVGSGPDIVMGWFDDPHLYADKVHDLTDLADYLGGKYGGWYDIVKRYCLHDGRWIAVGMGVLGGCITYRRSMVEAAGFKEIPNDLPGFLKLLQALKAKGTPCGFALGNAVGDANAWCHWVVWAFGGKMVDKSNKVTIDSPETLKALEYAKELYATFIPGTLSWLDPNNNKAFLDGQISVTNNGISIYVAAKNSQDPKLKEMAADINHASFPIGPVGVPTEYHLFFNQMIMKYTKYPHAAKEFLRFMMEAEQFDDWLKGGGGYVSHPLRAYEKNPVWTVDPKNTPYRDCTKNLRPAGYAGKLGYASAGALGDFIVPNMVAEAASGSKSPKEAAERAQKRAERYYKV